MVCGILLADYPYIGNQKALAVTKFIIQVLHNHGKSYLVLGDTPEDTRLGAKRAATRFNTRESAERALFLVDEARSLYGRRLQIYHAEVIKDEM